MDQDTDRIRLRDILSELIQIYGNCLWLLPFFFLAYLYIKASPIYIPELRLWLPDDTVFMAALFFSLFWLDRRALRKALSVNFGTKLCFYLLPVSAVLFLHFAQWHLIPSIVTAALLSAASIAYGVRLWRGPRRALLSVTCRLPNEEEIILWRSPKPTSRRLIRKWQRFTVVLFAAALFLPGFFGGAVVHELQAPYYTARQELWLDILSEAEDGGEAEAEAVPYPPALLERFQSDVWSAYSRQEKLNAMQALIQLSCLRLGLAEDAVPLLQTTALEGDVSAYFDPTDWTITLNLRDLSEQEPAELFFPLLQTVFQAYQYYLVSAVDWDSDAAQTAFFNSLRSLKQAMDAQPSASAAVRATEAGAQAWAREETKLLRSLL